MRHFAYWADPPCWTAWLLYAANRWWGIPHLGGTFLRGYLNDCLLIPAAIPPVLWLQRILRLRHHDQPPRWSEIWFHAAVWSVLFEYVGPRMLCVTGDPWDVLAYMVGGLACGLWWNRPAGTPWPA